MNDLAKNLVLWIVIALVLMTVFNNFGPRTPNRQSVDYSDFIGEVQQVINMFLGISPPGNYADCDGNGTLSIGEVQKVINVFLGLTVDC